MLSYIDFLIIIYNLFDKTLHTCLPRLKRHLLAVKGRGANIWAISGEQWEVSGNTWAMSGNIWAMSSDTKFSNWAQF